MKRHAVAFVIGSFAVMLLGGCQAAHPRGTGWEYKVVSARLYYQGYPEAALGQKINQAASEGWEVLSSGSDDGLPFVILRKPK